MTLKPALIALLALLLAGCNSSSNGGDSNGENGSTPPPGDNGTTPPPGGNGALTPAEVFQFSSALSYSKSYSGNSQWAKPVASAYDGNPADQDQRLMMDTALLGNALVAVPYHLAGQVVSKLGLEPANLVDFLQESTCPAGPASLGGQSTGQAVGPACVQAGSSDNSVIDFSGQISWSQNHSDYALTLEFDQFDLQWRGESFELAGAGALYSDLNWLLLAMDITHTATGATYRYWVRHQFGLSVTQPAIDKIAFHPDLGGIFQLAEGAFNNDSSCVGGGYDEKSGALANFSVPAEARAAFFYEFVGCDIYQIGAGVSTDDNEAAVVPELSPAYASLGIDVGLSQLAWRGGTGSHFQLVQENPGSTLLTPTSVNLAKLGTEGTESAYTQYHLALSFDMSDLPAGISTEDDILAASLRLHQGEGNNPYLFLRASLEEWSGTPVAEFTPDSHPANLAGNSSLIEPQPWLWADATSWVKLAIEQSRDNLQIIVGITVITLTEGNAFSLVCLQSSDDCDGAKLPTLEVIY